VSSKFRHFGAFAPAETERQVLAISFDDAGLVSNIERFGLQDGNVIVLSRRVTDNGVRDSTFIRQLLGSIGRVNAGDFLGEG
jgi:outer membrane protein assembly factor BamE (lipoprotein component of BamABCDE complex)